MEAAQGVGPHVGVDDVGLGEQSVEDGLAVGGLQVDANAAFVAVAAVGDVHGVPPRVAKAVDLDDVGAHVGQYLSAERAGHGETQVQHGDAGQRTAARHG